MLKFFLFISKHTRFANSADFRVYGAASSSAHIMAVVAHGVPLDRLSWLRAPSMLLVD